jgi:hypothetical protein
MTEQLDPALLAPIEKVARFIETGDDRLLSAFADEGVVIIENFAPHLFEGTDAVKRWSQAISSWHSQPRELELVHSFGPVQDLSVRNGLAFLSLPTHWTGLKNGVRFHEDGGWAFVLVQEQGEWRVRCYGWAVTHNEEED